MTVWSTCASPPSRICLTVLSLYQGDEFVAGTHLLWVLGVAYIYIYIYSFLTIYTSLSFHFSSWPIVY